MSTTAQLDERIAQFRKMANDDPDNELGHFRLGQLLMEAGRWEEAVASLRRARELSPFSRVFLLLGQSLIQLGNKEEAAQVLAEGFKVADQRGDNVPRDEMGKLLVQLGQPVPEARPAKSDEARSAAGFPCQRPGCTATFPRQLPRPPMSDEIGQQIYEKVCAECWEYWLRNLSIKVINEMRLDLSTEKHVEIYDQLMRETLGLT
jgi:Fe-S cluster biosynthesis and repair protein YggX